MKKYIVELTCEERTQLEKLVKNGKNAAYRIARAGILLRVDQGPHGPALTDDQVVEAVGCGSATVERLRKRFVEQGLRNVRAGGSAAAGRQTRNPLHAEARQLAEHGGNRNRRPQPPMPVGVPCNA